MIRNICAPSFFSDEELCCLVDGVTSPSNESNSLRLNNRISLETSCSDQTAYSKTHEVKTIHDLTGPNTLTKPLDDISGTANISPLSEYQSQNLNSGSLDIKFKAHLQVQRSLVATCDVSEPRRHRPRPGESGLRLIPNDSQEHPDSRNVFRSSNTATQHSVDDTLSPSIITLTGSELSHCLSQSNGSKHSAETQYHHKTDSDKSHVQGFRRSVKASEKGLITNSEKKCTECKNDFGRILSPHSEACAIDSCGCVETAEGGLQSSHRYGHVLAWNKASGSRSGQQVSIKVHRFKCVISAIFCCMICFSQCVWFICNGKRQSVQICTQSQSNSHLLFDPILKMDLDRK